MATTTKKFWTIGTVNYRGERTHFNGFKYITDLSQVPERYYFESAEAARAFQIKYYLHTSTRPHLNEIVVEEPQTISYYRRLQKSLGALRKQGYKLNCKLTANTKTLEAELARLTT